MRRLFKPRHARRIGFFVFMGFVLFVALRILTPPTELVQRISAPDGSREARLMHVYYYSDPGYKVATRSGLLWHTRLYIPEYKDVPVEDRNVVLRWSRDSKELFLEINGRTIWSETF